MNLLRQDRSEFNVLFVHSELDDYGLSSNEFRIYAHLARRANGKKKAYPGITSMATSCRMNRHTVLFVINCLEFYGLIKIIKRSGALNEYLLTAPSEWKQPKPLSPTEAKYRRPNGAFLSIGAPNGTSAPEGTGACLGTGIKKGTGVVPEITQPVSKEALKGNPREGNPFKDNTVGGRFSDSETPSVPPSDSSPVPDGRLPDGNPALSRQNAGKNFNPHPFKPSQSPIERKAYAMSDYLAHFHWDNCKVRFSKETARSYSEKALRDGHDENAIFKAYDKALHYCHDLTTDEICRRERHRYKKATPALTVWLARECLAGDPRTVEERWKIVIARLTTEKRKAIEEEARLQEEVARKAPEIKAWFANRLHREASRTNQALPTEVEAEAIAV